jgi:hypothetical protein
MREMPVNAAAAMRKNLFIRSFVLCFQNGYPVGGQAGRARVKDSENYLFLQESVY